MSTGIAGHFYAITIIDGNNPAQVIRLHINHYNGNRYEFLTAILECMSKFSALVGFSILERNTENFFTVRPGYDTTTKKAIIDYPGCTYSVLI